MSGLYGCNELFVGRARAKNCHSAMSVFSLWRMLCQESSSKSEPVVYRKVDIYTGSVKLPL